MMALRLGRRCLGDPARRTMILLVIAGLVGCQPAPPTPARPAKPAPQAARPGAENAAPEQAAITDPCAVRLQDICGTMLLYYAVHRELPEKLEELQSLADVGAPLQFKCPVSGLPYVYIPDGLQSLGRTKRIVLHDATSVHDGNRWCVLCAPIKGGKAPYLEVIMMPDVLFHTYLPISEQR